MECLGQFVQIVLSALMALDGNAYGVTIHAKVEELSRPKKIARGAVYATLDRMEDKSLISSLAVGAHQRTRRPFPPPLPFGKIR